ncbi:MAG TPA: hypothetical protein VGB85_29985, partial [Nannocystis sp.]
MLHVYFAGILALSASPSTDDAADTLSARAASIEAEVVALTQRNEAMQAGKLAAQAMRGSDLSNHDRYHLGALAFDAYMVAHINNPSVAALCEARRVARAMAKLATTPNEKTSARGLVGQVTSELAKLDPPGRCEPQAAR